MKVIATSTADPTKSDFANVTLDPLRLNVAPSRITLTVGQTQSFSVTSPNGSANVTYLLQPLGFGTVSATGTYTAPTSIPAETEVRLIARSNVDPTREVAATITLQPLRLTITPTTATLGFSESRQFTASVQPGLMVR